MLRKASPKVWWMQLRARTKKEKGRHQMFVNIANPRFRQTLTSVLIAERKPRLETGYVRTVLCVLLISFPQSVSG